MAGGRDIDVDMALAARRIAGATRTAARGARTEPKREERALLLLQGEELLRQLRPNRRVRRGLLQRGQRRRWPRHERLGRRRLRRGRRRGRVWVVVMVGRGGGGRASCDRLPILEKNNQFYYLCTGRIFLLFHM